jgi:HAE1 family hydrophobic/amphiphilic exporter-1
MSLLARLSLAHRGLVALIALVVTGFGAFAVPSLKQQLLPSMEIPAAFVVAGYPGAGPEIVEAQVTVPIENAIAGLPGVDEVTSTSREGMATVQVAYTFGTDIENAVARMQNALSRIDAQLPDGVDPMVLAGSTDDLPAMVLAATDAGDGDEEALARRLTTSVLPELEAIGDVRGVELTGARDPIVLITPDPEKLARAKVEPSAIGDALRDNGVAVPAGMVTEGDRTRVVQVGTPLRSLDDLRDLYVGPGTRRSGPVRLGDVATVEQQLAAPTSLTRTNGEPSLGISITAVRDGNVVRISQEVRERLAELGEIAGADLTVVFDQAPYIEKSIDTLTTEGLLGLVMAVLVILVFLLSVRSTLVTAVSIPLSVLAALLALWVGGHSLNLLTLGALTIAVGRVVDDSIVVLENIKRHLGYGAARRDAILRGVREVAGAVTASTLTTVAVFAPIVLVGGFVGELFAPFAITVTVALLASLLVSLTVIPVLAYWFLKPAGGGIDPDEVRRTAEAREWRNPLQRAYLPVIRFALDHRWITVGAGLLVLVGTLGLATRLETNFLDDSGQDSLTIVQELPAGTSLAATDAAARQVEGVLAGTAAVATYQVTVGGGGLFGTGGGNASANFSVTLEPDADIVAVKRDLRAAFDQLSGVGELRFAGVNPGGGSTDEIRVIVQAADPETLLRTTERVRQAMTETARIGDVTSNLGQSVPRLDVTVDRAKAVRAGLSEAAIGQLVARAFSGGGQLGQVTVDGVARDVVLSTGQRPPADLGELRNLRVGGVRLRDVAEVAEVDGPLAITRIDGARSATVSGTAEGSDLGAITQALRERLNGIDEPGATITIGGVSADQAEAFTDLGWAMLAAIVIVFIIMVATFRSLVQALILLVSVPFAATGAILGLLATGIPLGVPALIGMLMLVGIVVTNAIVLLDLINQYRDQGMDVRTAVIEGGRRRLRPILMTAIATIFALLPMALGITGEGGFISQPLAVVVIGGLLSSTLLTLALVPALYYLTERTRERLWGVRPASDPVGAAMTPSVKTPTAGAVNGAQAMRDGDGGKSTPSAGGSPAGRSVALTEDTNQFEVLRLPKSRRSPLPPNEG